MDIILKNEYSEKWFKMILENKEKIVDLEQKTNFEIVCFNPLLTNEIILNNPNEKWDWNILKQWNKNITLMPPCSIHSIHNCNYYLECKHKYLKHYYTSKCFPSSIEDNIIKFSLLYKTSPNELFEKIETKFNKELRIRKKYFWRNLSANHKLTLKLIKNNLDNPWNWSFISLNNLANDCKKYINNCKKKLLLTQILKCKKLNIIKSLVKLVENQL